MKSVLMILSVLIAAVVFLASAASTVRADTVYANVLIDGRSALPGDEVAINWPFSHKPVAPPAVTPTGTCPCNGGACVVPPAACTPPSACTPSACGACDNSEEASGRRHPVLRLAAGGVKAAIGHERRAERRAGRQE